MSETSCSDYLREYLQFRDEVVLNVDTQFDDNVLTFWELEQYLLLHNEKNAVKLLHDLYKKVRIIVTHMRADIVNDVTIELLLMFINEKKYLNEHHKKIKQKFGDVSSAVATNIFSIVQKLKSNLNYKSLEYINKRIHKSYSEPCELLCIPLLYKSSDELRSKLKNYKTCKYNNGNAVNNFSMLYNGSTINSVKPAHSSLKANNKSVMSSLKEFNVTSYSDELFCSQIIDMLVASGKELQTELYKYLGFKNAECFEFLRMNKSKILEFAGISVPKQNATSLPSYAIQVTVQSKQEKVLSKQLKKIEKKKQKAGIEDITTHFSHL